MSTKERVNMQNIIDTSNLDEISAFLTTTYISHSYEVESTANIISLWDSLRKNVSIKADLDHISALLATGRIMDYGFEIKDPNIFNSIITDINKNMETRNLESKDLQ
ncbi:MAG: hypothetical protein JSW28_01270, partial [Thermoplasmata archaeon]